MAEAPSNIIDWWSHCEKSAMLVRPDFWSREAVCKDNAGKKDKDTRAERRTKKRSSQYKGICRRSGRPAAAMHESSADRRAHAAAALGSRMGRDGGGALAIARTALIVPSPPACKTRTSTSKTHTSAIRQHPEPAAPRYDDAGAPWLNNAVAGLRAPVRASSNASGPPVVPRLHEEGTGEKGSLMVQTPRGMRVEHAEEWAGGTVVRSGARRRAQGKRRRQIGDRGLSIESPAASAKSHVQSSLSVGFERAPHSRAKHMAGSARGLRLEDSEGEGERRVPATWRGALAVRRRPKLRHSICIPLDFTLKGRRPCARAPHVHAVRAEARRSSGAKERATMRRAREARAQAWRDTRRARSSSTVLERRERTRALLLRLQRSSGTPTRLRARHTTTRRQGPAGSGSPPVSRTRTSPSPTSALGDGQRRSESALLAHDRASARTRGERFGELQEAPFGSQRLNLVLQGVRERGGEDERADRRMGWGARGAYTDPNRLHGEGKDKHERRVWEGHSSPGPTERAGDAAKGATGELASYRNRACLFLLRWNIEPGGREGGDGTRTGGAIVKTGCLPDAGRFPSSLLRQGGLGDGRRRLIDEARGRAITGDAAKGAMSPGVARYREQHARGSFHCAEELSAREDEEAGTTRGPRRRTRANGGCGEGDGARRTPCLARCRRDWRPLSVCDRPNARTHKLKAGAMSTGFGQLGSASFCCSNQPREGEEALDRGERGRTREGRDADGAEGAMSKVDGACQRASFCCSNRPREGEGRCIESRRGGRTRRREEWRSECSDSQRVSFCCSNRARARKRIPRMRGRSCRGGGLGSQRARSRRIAGKGGRTCRGGRRECEGQRGREGARGRGPPVGAPSSAMWSRIGELRQLARLFPLLQSGAREDEELAGKRRDGGRVEEVGWRARGARGEGRESEGAAGSGSLYPAPAHRGCWRMLRKCACAPLERVRPQVAGTATARGRNRRGIREQTTRHMRDALHPAARMRSPSLPLHSVTWVGAAREKRKLALARRIGRARAGRVQGAYGGQRRYGGGLSKTSASTTRGFCGSFVSACSAQHRKDVPAASDVLLRRRLQPASSAFTPAGTWTRTALSPVARGWGRLRRRCYLPAHGRAQRRIPRDMPVEPVEPRVVSFSSASVRIWVGSAALMRTGLMWLRLIGKLACGGKKKEGTENSIPSAYSAAYRKGGIERPSTLAAARARSRRLAALRDIDTTFGLELQRARTESEEEHFGTSVCILRPRYGLAEVDGGWNRRTSQALVQQASLKRQPKQGDEKCPATWFLEHGRVVTQTQTLGVVLCIWI
ncbi:hypothetical protein DFH09DRAFT_1284361 [Mycena vulgaris]|nr:hypothetical protein DFH09DRAFT_1284361 [Mycena vulgaris]